MVVQTGERGKPKVEAGGAWRVLTDEEWERAQAAGGPYHPNNGRWSSQVRLAGIVHCAEGHRMKVAGARGGGKTVGPAYTCTHPTCSSRTTIRASQLDEFVAGVLHDAVLADEPRVAAVLAGDDRYQTALNAVEFARTELDAFVETASVVDLGQDAWVRGKQARQAALEAARATVKTIPPTTKAYSRPLPISQKRWAALSVEERREIVEAAMDRDAHAKFIARIEVQKVGQGRKVAPAERVSIWFVGAEESADLTVAATTAAT